MQKKEKKMKETKVNGRRKDKRATEKQEQWAQVTEEQGEKGKNILSALPLLLDKQWVPCDNSLTDSNDEMYLENFPIPAQPDLLGGVAQGHMRSMIRPVCCGPSLHPVNLRELSCCWIIEGAPNDALKNYTTDLIYLEKLEKKKKIGKFVGVRWNFTKDECFPSLLG